MAKDLFSKKDLIKVMLSEPTDSADTDQMYFNLNEELEIELCVNFDQYAESDEDGYYIHDTYRIRITYAYIEYKDKFFPVNFEKEELEKCKFSDELYETIREEYLSKD